MSNLKPTLSLKSRVQYRKLPVKPTSEMLAAIVDEANRFRTINDPSADRAIYDRLLSFGQELD